jgi:hypothetical protein
MEISFEIIIIKMKMVACQVAADKMGKRFAIIIIIILYIFILSFSFFESLLNLSSRLRPSSITRDFVHKKERRMLYCRNVRKGKPHLRR